MKFQLKAAVILALFAGFAFAASNAFAQAMGSTKEGVTMKISGGADASFGTISSEKLDSKKKVTSESGYGAAIQSNIILSGKDGTIDYYVRLRLRGERSKTANNGGKDSLKSNEAPLQTARVRVRWTPVPVFSVTLGRLPGYGGTGFADIQPGRAYVGVGGVNKAIFADVPTLQLQVAPGPVKVGLLLSNGAQKASGTVRAINQTSTGLYAQASFAGIKLGFRQVGYVGKGLAKGDEDRLIRPLGPEETATGMSAAAAEKDLVQISGIAGTPMNPPTHIVTVAGTTSLAAKIRRLAEIRTVEQQVLAPKYKEEASTTVIEAAYEGGPVYVAFEMTSGDEVASSAADTASLKQFAKETAKKYSALGIAAKFKFGQGEAYFQNSNVTSGEDTKEKSKKEVASMSIGYKHKMGSKAAIGIEQASVKTTATKKGEAGKPTTDSALRFFILTGF